jgi:hypothetical protein
MSGDKRGPPDRSPERRSAASGKGSASELHEQPATHKIAARRAERKLPTQARLRAARLFLAPAPRHGKVKLLEHPVSECDRAEQRQFLQMTVDVPGVRNPLRTPALTLRRRK